MSWTASEFRVGFHRPYPPPRAVRWSVQGHDRSNDLGVLSVQPACATVACMADSAPSSLEDVLDDLLESAQRLAIDVIGCSPDMRDEVMVRMGILLTEVAKETGCTRELALEFASAMEQVVRDYVAEIEASGGG